MFIFFSFVIFIRNAIFPFFVLGSLMSDQKKTVIHISFYRFFFFLTLLFFSLFSHDFTVFVCGKKNINK